MPHFFFLLFLTLGSALATSDPIAEALVQRAVARDQVLLERRAAYSCTATAVREKLDRNGVATRTTTEKTTLSAAASPDYETRKMPDKMKGMEGDLKKASREEPFNILNIISHFNYEMDGEEIIHGQPCYRIRFFPKGGQPFRNREEKVANELEGYFWVAKKDDTLMKNQGQLTKPVAVAWFFATLREMEFSFETDRLPNGDFGPHKIQYRFQVNTPFGQIHERHTRIMSDYRKQ